MNKNYIIAALFVSFVSNAQFIHLNAGIKSKDPVTVFYENNETKSGFAKNNPPSYVALRILNSGTDANAMAHPDLLVDTFGFKIDEAEKDYVDIPLSDVKKVVFHSESPIVYEKILMYEVSSRSATVDRKKEKIFFLPESGLSGFQRYRLFTSTSASATGKGGLISVSYFAKNPYNNEVYAFNRWILAMHSRQMNYFKVLGADCPEFVNYVTILQDKKSPEYKDFDKAKELFYEAYLANTKEIYNKSKEHRYYAAQLKVCKIHEFLYSFLYDKYVSFNCKLYDE